MIKELVVDWSASLDMQRALDQGCAYCVTRRIRGEERQRLVVTRASPNVLETSRRGFEIIRMQPEVVEGMDVLKFLYRPFGKTWILGGLAQQGLPASHGSIAKTYGAKCARLLASTRVLVVGAGRAGSAVIGGLLQAGFLHITCVDPDLVEERNTILTAYDAATLGRPKVDILAALAQSNGAVYVPVQQDIVDFARPRTRDGELFSRLADFDLAFSAVDRASPRASLAAACSISGVPMIDVGTSVTPSRDRSQPPSMQGRILVTIPGRECHLCLREALDPQTCQAELDGRMPAYAGDATFSRLLGTQAVLEAIGLFAGGDRANSNQVIISLGSNRQMVTRSRRTRVSSTCRYCRPNPGGDDRARTGSANEDGCLAGVFWFITVLGAGATMGLGIAVHWWFFVSSAGLLLLGMALLIGSAEVERRRS